MQRMTERTSAETQRLGGALDCAALYRVYLNVPYMRCGNAALPVVQADGGFDEQRFSLIDKRFTMREQTDDF
jgi:hypothetical protein